MMAIFSDMVDKTIEVFMDDFSVLGNSFDNCLENLRSCVDQMRGDQPCTQLGEVPFYGTRVHCT